MQRALLPLYALVFLETLVWIAIVPLAPSFADGLALSEVETGMLLAVASLAALVCSFPLGLLADRVGVRRVTVGSAVLFTLATLGQGLAGDFWSLLLARGAFGIAFGALWTAGLAWLSDATPRRLRARALGATVTVAGVAFTLGPAFAGFLGDSYDPNAPFLPLAAAAAVVTAALVAAPPAAGTHAARQSLGATVRAVRADELVLGGLVIMALIGFVAGGINLLVPLRLEEHGVSATRIGILFSVASGIYTLVSAVVARRGERAVSLRLAGIAALATAATLGLLVASGSAAAAVAFVLLRAPFWAAMDTIGYPLGAAGAHRASLARGTVMGLLTLGWGATSAVGPLAAGALSAVGGERAAYVLLLAACAAAGTWMLTTHREGGQALDERAARGEAS